MNISSIAPLILMLYVYVLSTPARKQPGCPDNINADIFYKTVATGPQEQWKSWLCEETFEFRVNVCSSLYKDHILRKFDFETIKVAKHKDTVLHEDCVPHKMRFQDKEVPAFDVRVDVRMFRCPVKFKVKDPESALPDEEIEREFFITRGIADRTVTLLLTSTDKKQKPNICLEEIFWFNDTNPMNANLSDIQIEFQNKKSD